MSDSAPSDQASCPQCGAALVPHVSEAELVDEIRTVTVLFADVAGSTEMTAQLGLEAVKQLMDQVFQRIYDVVLEHGGKVDKFIGDCVMALFGAPLAYGDDPSRGVRAALALLRAVAEMGPELQQQGLPLVRMRVGINTGPVIAGPVGAGPERRYTVLGHAVNVAAHLQQEAPVGGVLLGPGTYRRVRGLFRLTEQQTKTCGTAYLAREERPDGLWLRPRDILGKEIGMVGRQQELRALLDLFEASRATPEARLVVISGEPGVGKSRLAFEFLSRLEQLYPAVERIVSLAHPVSSGIPFSVAGDALRRRLGIVAGAAAEEAVARVRQVLQGLGRPQPETDLRALTHILGLPAAPDQPAHAPGLPPERVLDLLLQLVEWLTEHGPAVVLADNLHWSDGPSLTLLGHLLERLSRRALFIVATARPEFLAQEPELLRGPRRNRIALAPLDQHAMRTLLGKAVGELQESDLLQLVTSRAQGNPYHAEELLRALQERGVLVRRVGGWDLSEVPADLGIPPGVEAVTQARIDNLSSEQRRLLSHAAVIGGTFWDGLLRQLVPQSSAKDLSVLVERELVARRPGSSFPQQQEYSFVHDLTRGVAYRMLPEQRRTELHRLVARWMVEQGAAGAEQLAQVADHLDRGARPEEAARYLCEAGDAAAGAAAYTTAVLHYSRAAELAQSRTLLFDLLARRERVLNALGRWTEQRSDATRMLELATELGQEAQRVEALLRVGRSLLNLGVQQEAHAAFSDARRLAQRLDDAAAEARALRWLAMYHFNRSEHLQARELFERALELARDDGHHGLTAELSYELGVTAGTVGDYERALSVSSEALDQFRQQGNRYQEAYCLANIGCFHIYLGECERAVPALEQAAALGRELRVPLAEATAKANLGNALRLQGELEQAAALEQEAHSVSQEIGDSRLAADALIYGALIGLDAQQRGLTPAADPLELALEALGVAQEHSMPGTEAIVHMVLARALAVRDQLEQALAHSHDAVQILGRIGSVEGFEYAILAQHGALSATAGDAEAARHYSDLAQRELVRKADYIADPGRRERFVQMVRSSAPRAEQDRGA